MSESAFKDGFYAVFFSGSSGEGYGVFIFQAGQIVGADPLGVVFDGSYSITGETITAKVRVMAPPGGELIQGAIPGPSGLTYEVPVTIPTDVAEQPFVRIDTPLGPVNARFKWLRAAE